MIGQTLAASAPPDGYTLLLAGGAMAGLRFVNANKVSAEGLVDVIAGRVDYYFVGSAAAVANKARLRALAVTTATRSTVFPDVPTITEAALPGFDMPSAVA